jgi:hypothetical protein
MEEHGNIKSSIVSASLSFSITRTTTYHLFWYWHYQRESFLQ